ncbi:beta-glucosidase, partial [hydrothermal vent metagenome]
MKAVSKILYILIILFSTNFAQQTEVVSLTEQDAYSVNNLQGIESEGIKTNHQKAIPKMRDPALPIKDRVRSVLDEMTLEEKVDFVSGAGFTTKPNIRLGLPIIAMTDGPLGPNAKGKATNYSSALNMAATWDDSLMNVIAASMGAETRVMGRNMLLGPCINIARIPQGGRTFEGFGEDPFLTSRMAVAYVKGVQSKNVIACPKHFAVNNQEWNRGVVNVELSERALREIYFPAFKAVVQEADAQSIMAAYNKLRGTYCCSNHELLTDVLRNEWGFNGFVVSDWGGVHNTVQTANSGLDLEMPDGKYLGDSLLTAIDDGLVSEDRVDSMVSHILTVMFKTGLFDESIIDYGGLSDTEERRALALETARKSIVLLKND